MESKRNTEEKLVIDNVKRFLNSDKKDLMNFCYFSIISNENNRYFRDTINVANNDEFDSLFPLVSVVILTANKIECDSLNYVVSKQKDNDLKKRKEAIKIFENADLGGPDAYLFKMNSVYILHLHAYETGANTPGGSTDLVRFISNNPLINPLSIISFGICYGRDPHNQNIGDVLIPKKLYPWSIGQKIGDKGLNIKHDDFNLWLEDKFPGSGIYPILNNFCNGEDGRILTDSVEVKKENRKNVKKCTFAIKIVWGNMSTGEAVISSQKAKKEIQKATNNEKELGGEMEGYGIAKECIYYAKVPCFIVKAICDWGVCKDIDKKLKEEQVSCPENLKDRLQAYAAFCAAIVLLKLLGCEKENFLSLEIIKWMGNQRGKDCILEGEYVEKDRIIRNIKKYYNVNEMRANKIFKIFLENKIFIKSNNQYRINY